MGAGRGAAEGRLAGRPSPIFERLMNRTSLEKSGSVFLRAPGFARRPRAHS